MEVQSPRRPLLDLFLWFLVLVMTVVVIYASVAPPSGDPLPLSDKVFHYLAYLGLNFSLLLAAVWAPVRGEGRFPTAPLAITLVAFVFGVGIEIVQAPLPERDASMGDAVANGGGAITALLAWLLLRMMLQTRRAS